MIAYNADSPTLYGFLYHYPATSRDNKNENKRQAWNTTRRIYSWDTGAFLGEIPESNVTFNVVGNANEHGLIIGETTFGGVPILANGQKDGILDYGSLIYITLQRAKSVDEAIDVMVDLLDSYGYASSGESFSLADASGSVWMMEIIGRGDAYGKRGAVWVARKISRTHHHLCTGRSRKRSVCTRRGRCGRVL
jgi:dipeptidase